MEDSRVVIKVDEHLWCLVVWQLITADSQVSLSNGFSSLSLSLHSL